MLDKLGESLSKAVRRIALSGLVDEKIIKEAVKEIQRALLSADVNVRLVMEISKRIEERALQEKPKGGLSRREHAIAIVHEELVNLLGKREEFRPTKGRIMLVGLQGSGKTTTAVKLAKFYAKRGLKPYIIAGDTFRPAAYEQMRQLAEPLKIGVFGDPSAKDPIALLERGLAEARGDLIILDTAGRHRSEEELFREMKKLEGAFSPQERLLVIDSTIGQQAGAQAKAFHEAIGITGVILTKLDGSAKGGGALSAVAETSAPIRFIGLGERLDDLELFDSGRFISRLLGMGDLKGLLEKAQETMDEGKAREIMKGDLTLYDLQEQIRAISKMGPLSAVLKMIPGMGTAVPKEATEVTEAKMRKFSTIIDSMTRREREEPKAIDSSRMRRIARGSGSTVEEVKELLNYYWTMKKALKGLRRGAKGPWAKLMRGGMR
ncbi:MAG: signal recognition particle protein Srp54 [Candidatus Hydrothermarchaeota archaeon]